MIDYVPIEKMMCSICHRWKLFSNMRRPKESDGLNYYCRKCLSRAKDKKYYREHCEQKKAYARNYYKKEKRKFLYKYKDGSCMHTRRSVDATHSVCDDCGNAIYFN